MKFSAALAVPLLQLLVTRAAVVRRDEEQVFLLPHAQGIILRPTPTRNAIRPPTTTTSSKTAPTAQPTAAPPKLVFAHHIVGNTYNYTMTSWQNGQPPLLISSTKLSRNNIWQTSSWRRRKASTPLLSM